MHHSAWIVSVVVATAAQVACNKDHDDPPPPPVLAITAVSPNAATNAGGTTVTISGNVFDVGATVTIGGVAATSVVVVDYWNITAVTPSLAPTMGPVNVVVTNPGGASVTLTGGFIAQGTAPTVTAVSPDTGPRSGGLTLTVTGTDFVAGATVQVWDEPFPWLTGATASTLTSVVVVSPTSITAVLPTVPTAFGSGCVSVTNVDLQQASGLFTFSGSPVMNWGNVVYSTTAINDGTLVTDPSSGGDDEIVAVVYDGTDLYVIGHCVPRPGGSPRPEWRIEKRSGATSALVTGFGTSGVVVINPDTTAGAEYPTAAVTDGTDLYIAGYSLGGWRIEKRALSNGALVAGFGTSGVVTFVASNAGSVPTAIVHDGTDLYIGGSDAGPGASDFQWRIEKRSLSAGALVAGFGSSGVYTSNPSTSVDQLLALVHDGTDLYAAGTDLIAASGSRIEKLSLAAGALVTAFGTNGVLTWIPSSGSLISPDVVAHDGTDLYIAGGSSSSGWTIVKRSMSAGAFVNGFGTSGVLTGVFGASAKSLLVDGSNLYIVGQGNTATSVCWRMECRSLSNGALVTGFGPAGTGVILSDPTTGSDVARHVMTDGSYLFVSGFQYDGNGPSSRFRMERRAK